MCRTCEAMHSKRVWENCWRQHWSASCFQCRGMLHTSDDCRVRLCDACYSSQCCSCHQNDSTTSRRICSYSAVCSNYASICDSCVSLQSGTVVCATRYQQTRSVSCTICEEQRALRGEYGRYCQRCFGRVFRDSDSTTSDCYYCHGPGITVARRSCTYNQACSNHVANCDRCAAVQQGTVVCSFCFQQLCQLSCFKCKEKCATGRTWPILPAVLWFGRRPRLDCFGMPLLS